MKQEFIPGFITLFVHYNHTYPGILAGKGRGLMSQTWQETHNRKIAILVERMNVFFCCLAILAIAAGMNFNTATGAEQAIQPWPELDYFPLASGFDLPTAITHAGDNSGRLFIAGQEGVIWAYQPASGVRTVFLDIRDRVTSPVNGGGGEEGLLGIAFAPRFKSNGHFYIYYTGMDSNNRVSRFQVVNNGSQADPASEKLILYMQHPARNHNGGQLAFGPDGYLYIGTGDGGTGGDLAQDGSSLLGKILRLQVEQALTQPPPQTMPAQVYFPLLVSAADPDRPPYTIPEDNPFLDRPNFLGEIWAMGLRNPWRFSFDRANGDLYIADVGQLIIEELNVQPSGAAGGQNYGWNILEGDRCYQNPSCSPNAYTSPVYTYTHTSGTETNCSITGGYMYRGPTVAALQGIYLFGDYCSGRIWGLQWDGGKAVVEELDNTGYQITTFGEDESGEVFVADRKSGDVFRVITASQ
jgi:glucose/arabinose dehydrogenase